jgi:hypothetical protein
VEQPSLARGHGREGVRLAGGTYLLNSSLGRELKMAIAGRFETFGIEGDAIVVFGLEPENLCCDVFDGVEEFAVLRQEEGSVGAAEIDFDAWTG